MSAEPTTPDTHAQVADDRSIALVLPGLLEVLASSAVVFAPDDTLRFRNDRARTVFAIDNLAPLASQSAAVVLGEMVDTLRPVIARVRTTRVAEACTVRREAPGRWLDIRALPLYADLVLVEATDVTAAKGRQTSLERSEQLLTAILGLLPVTVRLSDRSGRLEQAPDVGRADHLLQHPASVRELWERDAPRDVGTGERLLYLDMPGMRALSGETVLGQVLNTQRGDGGELRVIETSASPLHDAAGAVTGAVLVDRDITAQVRGEQGLEAERTELAVLRERVAREADRLEQLVEERARERLQLEESRSRDRRLAAVGQLAAGVMHDVNNALNPIMASAFLLRHHAESPDAVRDYADRISRAAETAAATASRVGRFIRQDPVHVGGDESLDLSVLANEVLDLTEPMRTRRADGREAVQIVRVLDLPVYSRGLPGEIREALLSLIQNSIDAMPRGGVLTVRTYIDGNDACLQVQDDGEGMSDDVRDRAFEPFFSTKGAGGTGLGLAEVYGIARRHRGTAAIESVQNVGTTVTLRLPAEASQASAPAAPAPPLAPAPTVPRRVLVVEDNDDGRHVLRRLLESRGHSIDAVANCSEARVRLAATDAPQYDLMLTDVGLPDGSGWDLVRFAHDHVPGIRVGVITGWEPMVSAENVAGVEFVLRKPLRAAELLAHIVGVMPSTPTK